jgi:hypothetical protein
LTDPLRTIGDYELFIYSIQERFRSIQRSALQFIRRGATLARVVGELEFAAGVRLVVRERLDCSRSPSVVDGYGHEAWHGEERLYWYDPQPHPDEPSLQRAIHITSTFRRIPSTIVSRRQN